MSCYLQGYGRGLLLRRELLASVRSDYEAIVSEINLDSQLLSEILNWPHPDRLCYPRFRMQEKSDGHLTASDRCSHEVVVSGGDGVLADGMQDAQELGSIILPKDRESLMDLRQQLLMELMWLKQAISSRQQVLLGTYR